jgi:hypothetical protein
LEENEILSGYNRCNRPKDTSLQLPSRCHDRATIFQQSHGENLIGRDGINKTLVWKKEEVRAFWELRTCGNVPTSARPCRYGTGQLFIRDDNRRR